MQETGNIAMRGTLSPEEIDLWSDNPQTRGEIPKNYKGMDEPKLRGGTSNRQTSSSLDVTITTLNKEELEKFTKYKGVSATEFKYNRNVENESDWGGCYLADTYEIAEGYVTDVKDQKEYETSLFEVKFSKKFIEEFADKFPQGLRICKVTGELITSGESSGDDKAKAIKEKLKSLGIDIEKEDKLINKLGEQGIIYHRTHDEEGNMELVLPWNMVSKELIDVKRIKRFKVKGYEAKEVK